MHMGCVRDWEDIMSADIAAGPSTGREASGTATRRQAWPLWGAAAGVLGFVGHMLTGPGAEVVQASDQGDVVIDMLSRGPYHLGAAAGIAGVFCLLVWAAGWRRWAASVPPSTLAAGAVAPALVASAGAMILGYGMKGSMAVYLSGGVNAGEFPAEGLYSLFMFLDLAPFMAWWGVSFAAVLLTWVALRERRLPIAVGVLSVLGWLPAVGFLGLTGLTGFAGVVGPVWLVIVSVVLAALRWSDGEP